MFRYFTSSTIPVLAIELLHVQVGEEVICERLSVEEAMQRRIEVARIPQIGQTYQPMHHADATLLPILLSHE